MICAKGTATRSPPAGKSLTPRREISDLPKGNLQPPEGKPPTSRREISRLARHHHSSFPELLQREVREDFGLAFCKSRRSDRRCKTPSPAPDTFLHKNDQTRGIDIEDGDSCRDVKIVTSRALRSPNLRLTTNNQRLIFHFMNRSIFKDQCP